MDITTIRVSKDLALKLNQLKYNYGYETIEEVINHYLNKRGGDSNEHTKNNELDKE